ncbi:hypothetical protein [Streptomyces sp. NPDC023327]|uniref:hypothetical protein n=1 Tax=Streptomyces sp. NPDC023327 TaxID=3157088 RepID=UPI003405C8D8
MHPDIHLALHHTRAEELRRAVPVRRPRARLRAWLGWAMVETGLRLVSSSGRRCPWRGSAGPRPFPSGW